MQQQPDGSSLINLCVGQALQFIEMVFAPNRQERHASAVARQLQVHFGVPDRVSDPCLGERRRRDPCPQFGNIAIADPTQARALSSGGRQGFRDIIAAGVNPHIQRKQSSRDHVVGHLRRVAKRDVAFETVDVLDVIGQPDFQLDLRVEGAEPGENRREQKVAAHRIDGNAYQAGRLAIQPL